jgi:hypothetical protein
MVSQRPEHGKPGRMHPLGAIVYRDVARVGTGTVQEWLVSERLGIVGMPDDLDEVLKHCAELNVEPMLVLDPEE